MYGEAKKQIKTATNGEKCTSTTLKRNCFMTNVFQFFSIYSLVVAGLI